MNEENIKCQRCKKSPERLNRYGNGDQWLCSECYLGLYLDHTPQTHWNENSDEKKYQRLKDQVLKIIPSNEELTEKRRYFLKNNGATAEGLAYFSYAFEIIERRINEIKYE